uniref:Uncharacterized protein n=1 Tax=Oryza meridionalis TaxID=40149 RepID=A0A0E0BWV9_9ORYZ
MCFKLGTCFGVGVGGGDDYYRGTHDPSSDHRGYKYTTVAADETGRKANNDVARKPVAAAATRDVYGRTADEPSPKPPAAARNSKVADDTGVKQPAAAAAPVISRYPGHVY